jgi:hypothetical protein
MDLPNLDGETDRESKIQNGISTQAQLFSAEFHLDFIWG